MGDAGDYSNIDSVWYCAWPVERWRDSRRNERCDVLDSRDDWHDLGWANYPYAKERISLLSPVCQVCVGRRIAMPELPEIETIKRGLQGLILNTKIVQCEVLNAKSFRGDAGQLVGQKSHARASRN